MYTYRLHFYILCGILCDFVFAGSIAAIRHKIYLNFQQVHNSLPLNKLFENFVKNQNHQKKL